MVDGLLEFSRADLLEMGVTDERARKLADDLRAAVERWRRQIDAGKLSPEMRFHYFNLARRGGLALEAFDKRNGG